MQIPKVFYHVWFGPAAPSETELECRRSVVRLHPDWRHVVVGDQSCAVEVADGTEYFPLEQLWKEPPLRAVGLNWACFLDRCLTGYRGRHSPKAIATDFVRTCVLYAFGGFVLDWDIYALRPFDRFVSDDIVFARIKPSLVAEAVMAARPEDERICDLLVKYVRSQAPESGTCCLNLSSFVERRELPAYAAEWFIPHRRDDDGTNLYAHSDNTHAVHLWRQRDYDLNRLEDIGRKLRGLPALARNPEERKPCGCWREGQRVDC
jgi:hypothetical protein